ncbi:VQ motif-containing protein 17-like [Olea europaea var. sylvestris]|uniref:VQ motif-containing protein 17-like n=1 Tax=Olea europaea var. sylvestris TaxID=158386 RepID=UPI000C1D02BC|nr:VQ motif-containing protein 17-like [Olea europaea var. sylvestris]
MKQPQTCDTILAPSKLGLDKYSHTISKTKPKIRIIHIVAPEIIKTEVENFREIVQRLTGKPTTAQGKGINVIKPMKKMESSGDVPVSQSSEHRMKKEIGEEILYGGQNSNGEEILYGEQNSNGEEILYGEQNSNGFLSFLGDVDCFINIQDMKEFHLPPFRSSSQMTLFGEMHNCY